MSSRLRLLLTAERRRQRTRLLVAGGSAGVVGAASVLLLGISGWFITAAALAGAGGAAAVAAFNFMLPSACIRLLAILRTGCRYAEQVSGHDAALRAMARVRPALYLGFAASPPARALAMPAGEAAARMVQDVDAVEADIVRRSSVWSTVGACGAGGLLLLLASGPALVCTAAVLAGLLIAARHLAAALDARGHAVLRANGRLKQEFTVLAAAAQELRAYGLEDWAAVRISEQADGLTAAQERTTAFGGWFDLAQNATPGLAAVLALGVSGGVSLPMAALAALGASMVIDGAAGHVRNLQQQGHLREAEARLDGMLGPVVRLAAGIPARPATTIGEVPTIELLDMQALLPPGCMVAIVGPSGCGKTTLIEGLLRLRNVEHGRIRLGGVEINDLDPGQARRCFAVAPQDAALLAGTVWDNLTLADPAVTEGDIWKALHDAALDERVRAMPAGLDSWLGEDGACLSGGERRRLVLARAYLRPAPWLLLDEPTEGLDAQTEAIVVERLRARLTARGQGAMIVSHRLTPTAACTVVLMLDGHCLYVPTGVIPIEIA